MERKEQKPKTLQQAIRHFSDEQTCIDTVAAMKWPNGPECPACQSKNHYYLATQKRWKCKECSRQFSVKLGTIFEDSPIGLDKWLAAMWMLANCKNGVSSYEIHRDLGVTQKTAWFMLQRLRVALGGGGFGRVTKIGDGGAGNTAVEVDETYVGGKVRNMHKSKRLRRNQAFPEGGPSAGKTIVMGMLDRNLRQVRAQVIPNVKRETLQNAVMKEVKYGTKVFTDAAVGYTGLPYRFVHDMVDHVETYVKGQVHTNGIENFWSLLKRTLSGTYVAVEPFHLDRYVDEQVFRFNNRGSKEHPVSDSDRFALALSQITGKRLTYAEVTGK